MVFDFKAAELAREEYEKMLQEALDELYKQIVRLEGKVIN